MSIFDRVREIIINPRVAWTEIKQENITVNQLFANYAAPLALIPAVCGLITMTILGIRLPAGGVMRMPFMSALIAVTVGYVVQLGGAYLGAMVINWLAPKFESKCDLVTALKLVIYAMTPVWLAGIFSLAPALNVLSLVGLYGIYLLALGLPVLLETPSNKVTLYVLSILGIGLVVNLVLSLLLVATVYGPLYMKMMAS